MATPLHDGTGSAPVLGSPLDPPAWHAARRRRRTTRSGGTHWLPPRPALHAVRVRGLLAQVATTRTKEPLTSDTDP
jgi:hypothetical protein